jgi:hypothetical protein
MIEKKRILFHADVIEEDDVDDEFIADVLASGGLGLGDGIWVMYVGGWPVVYTTSQDVLDRLLGELNYAVLNDDARLYLLLPRGMRIEDAEKLFFKALGENTRQEDDVQRVALQYLHGRHRAGKCYYEEPLAWYIHSLATSYGVRPCEVRERLGDRYYSYVSYAASEWIAEEYDAATKTPCYSFAEMPVDEDDDW